MAKFSIEEAIGFGWKTVKEHWTTLIPVVVGLFLINGLISLLLRHAHSNDFSFESGFRSLLSLASGNILSTVVAVIFSAIIVRVCLQYVDGNAKDVSSLFKGITPELIVKVIFASILLNIIVGIGFILLIIPGIYLALRYSQVTYVLIDKPETGIMEAFGESARLTDGAKWTLIGFAVVAVIVAFLGFVVVLVGALVSLPVVSVAAAHVYRQLTKSTGAKVEVAEPAPA
jgi:uncharacterized membrane protein